MTPDGIAKTKFAWLTDTRPNEDNAAHTLNQLMVRGDLFPKLQGKLILREFGKLPGMSEFKKSFPPLILLTCSVGRRAQRLFGG